ncbi:MAG TPA: hypothetical protein VFZ44_20765 [Pyrinomonadaceae bacterium]
MENPPETTSRVDVKVFFLSAVFTLCALVALTWLLKWLGGKSILGVDTNIFILSSWLAASAIFVLVWLLTWPQERRKFIWYDLLKDSALAVLTAVFVTAIYGSVLEFRRVSDLFSLFIGNEVRPEVLDVATSEIFKRELIRDNTEIRFIVTKDPKLPPYQALLRTEVGYDVYSLKPAGDREYRYVLSLDDTLKGKDLNGRALPRFEEVTIGNRILKGDELTANINDDGSFEDRQRTPLNPWPRQDGSVDQKTGVRIRSVRTQIIYIPTTHELILGELTKSIRVHVQTPDGIEHKFKSWFQRKGRDFQPEGNEQYFAGIALPGQSISLQFSDKSGQPAPATRSPAASPAQPKAKGR